MLIDTKASEHLQTLPDDVIAAAAAMPNGLALLLQRVKDSRR